MATDAEIKLSLKFAPPLSENKDVDKTLKEARAAKNRMETRKLIKALVAANSIY